MSIVSDCGALFEVLRRGGCFGCPDYGGVVKWPAFGTRRARALASAEVLQGFDFTRRSYVQMMLLDLTTNSTKLFLSNPSKLDAIYESAIGSLCLNKVIR